MKQYEIRDPVHKRIPFDAFERTIIDHPFVQRLRFIGQLSFLQTYVYPGGVHDRFSHALGAMHVADRLFGRLLTSSDELRSRFSDEEILELRQRVRLAGLLHDIGHGPFSHSSESVFPELSDLPLKHDWWQKIPKRQAQHEDYSVLLVQTMAEEGILEVDMAQDIASFIHGEVQPANSWQKYSERAPSLHKILKSLVSGEVDCDRMDYLLRDSYFCGVEYGRYDLDWLISSLGLVEHEGKLIFTIQENGVRAFEDMLLARYHMIDQVYFHKTKAGFQHYLEQAIAEREIELEIPTDPYEYAQMRDGKVIEQLFLAAQNDQNYWSAHLMHRIPAKRILRLHDQREVDQATLREIQELCEQNQVRWFAHAVANQLTHYGGPAESGMIFVAKKTLRGHEYVPISEYSGLIRQYSENIRFTDVFVRREDFVRYQAALN